MRSFLSAACAAAILTSVASAQEAPSYLQVHGGAFFIVQDDIELDGFGAVDTSFDPDTGFAVGALYGRRLTDAISIEGEFSYRSNETGAITVEANGTEVTTQFEPFDAEVFTVMGNAVYRLPTRGAFRPYVGAGLGFADVWDEDDVDGAFAYQVKGGVDFPVGRANSFGVEASYLGTSDLENDDVSLGYGGVNVLATYKFGF